MVDALHSHMKNYPADSTDRANALKLLQDLCLISGRPPSSFELRNITFDRSDVVGQGGEATVYRGRMNNRLVVVREVVKSRKDWNSPYGRKIIQLLYREAVTHSGLDHPNILPFLGVFYEADRSHPMMILPFIEMGSLKDLMAESNDAIIDRYLAQMIVGIGRGVAYLHSQNPPIIHGDLHPGNVLLGPLGRPLLCDFGLSRVRHEVTRTRTMIQEGGNARFMAPELSDGAAENFRSSQASDIFALSMTLLSIWIRQPPFHEVQNERKVAAMIRNGDRPTRPTKPLGLSSDVEANYWVLIVNMWAHEAQRRPPSEEVREDLELLMIFGSSAEAEAVMRDRERSKANTASHRAMFALSINVLGLARHKAGHYSEACNLCQEAVIIQRELFEAEREPHRENLALYLSALGHSLNQAGRFNDALVPHREAVALQQELFEVDRRPHRKMLAVYLHTLGNSLRDVKRHSESYAPYRQAIALQRELVEAKTGPLDRILALYLSDFGRSLYEAERYTEACVHLQEAVTLLRSLFEAEHGARHATELVTYLSVLGYSLRQAGRYSDACAPYQEAVTLQRELFKTDPESHRTTLTLYLYYLGRSLRQARRYSEACAPYQEAVTFQRELFEAEPGPHRDKLMHFLSEFRQCLLEAGRVSDAAVALREYLTVSQEQPTNIKSM